MNDVCSDRELLDLLYAAAGNPQGWDFFLKRLADDLQARWTGFLSIDPNREERSLHFQHGIPAEAQRLYEEYYGALDPWFLGYRKHGRCGWVGLGNELCPPDDFVQTEFCNDFFQFFDVRHECGAIIENEGGGLSVLTALRSPRQPDFSLQHASLLNSIIPHVKRVLALHGKIMDLKHSLAAAAGVVNCLDSGLIAVTKKGRICFANAMAEAVLQAGNFLRVHEGKLTVRNPRALPAWERLWQAATEPSHSHGPAKSLTLRSPEGALHITLLPFVGSTLLLPDQTRALLVITNPAAQPKPRDQRLMGLFGLTPTESRIAMLLLAGFDTKEIAEQTGTSQNTVRFQLKVIYRKTGVSRQSQLTRLVSMLPGES